MLNAPSIIVPQQLETASVRRGRAIIVEAIDRVLELHDKGRNPQRLVLSAAARDDMLAYFGYAYQFDGQLPATLSGVPIAVEPGADERMRIECGVRQ